MTNNLPEKSDILIYQTEDGRTRVEVRLQDETVWLSLQQMADLFQRDKSVISRHIRNIFKEGEVARPAVVAKFATTATDGKSGGRGGTPMKLGFSLKGSYGIEFDYAKKSTNRCSWRFAPRYLPGHRTEENFSR